MGCRHLSLATARRGSALVSVLVLLLVLAVFAATSASILGGGQEAFMMSADAAHALYAADSALERAVREHITGIDEDGDGTVGGVSGGGNATPPRIGRATYHVVYADGRFTATAVCGEARRVIEVTIE